MYKNHYDSSSVNLVLGDNTAGEEKCVARAELTTLCYIETPTQYLMLHRIKKENDVNKDKWVGIGGHFEAGESPEECLCREAREETGLTLTDYRLRGIVTFVSDRWSTEYMFLYTADGYEGELRECDEGQLEWIDKSAVYDLPIWEGDRVFFRLLEQNEPFFSLKLRYEGERLAECVLNGKRLEREEVYDLGKEDRGDNLALQR